MLNTRHGVAVVENLRLAGLAAEGVTEFLLVVAHAKLRGATVGRGWRRWRSSEQQPCIGQPAAGGTFWFRAKTLPGSIRRLHAVSRRHVAGG